MKTAMQELIDDIRFTDKECYATIFDEGIFKIALEKEKEQIIQARIDGDENYSLVGGKRYEYAEQYYNQTYNQNK
jgi:hypothetical protein